MIWAPRYLWDVARNRPQSRGRDPIGLGCRGAGEGRSRRQRGASTPRRTLAPAARPSGSDRPRGDDGRIRRGSLPVAGGGEGLPGRSGICRRRPCCWAQPIGFPRPSGWARRSGFSRMWRPAARSSAVGSNPRGGPRSAWQGSIPRTFSRRSPPTSHGNAASPPSFSVRGQGPRPNAAAPEEGPLSGQSAVAEVVRTRGTDQPPSNDECTARSRTPARRLSCRRS